MYVIDEITGEKIDSRKAYQVAIGQTDKMVILGYVSQESFNDSIEVMFYRPYACKFNAIKSRFDGKLLYSRKQGMYFSTIGLSKSEILREQYTNGQGIFPYKFERRYEAVESFDLFSGNQRVVNDKPHQLSNFLDYTFGLEFETSGGLIPEDLCFRDGLIPLRDGSIQGLEYSTVVLRGNEGLCLLDQQLDTLKKYTGFNKECSLHIHMGGYPLRKDTIFSLYSVCMAIQNDLKKLLPPYTFTSSKYKASGKDYCKVLPRFDRFEDLYESLVGLRFFGDFSQPHPNDVRREAKWRIGTRYYWLNLINALCYKVNKTIEFRFLRPTYNRKKIYTWLYILNGILKYAQNNTEFNWTRNSIHLTDIMDSVYPEEVSEQIKEEITMLGILITNQSNSGDNIGADMMLEYDLFPENDESLT